MSDTPEIDTPAFLTRLRAGEDAAYERLVRDSSGQLLAVARRILANEDDAMEAVQDAFSSAFRRLADFDGNSRLTTWLYRIAVNASLMKLRARRRRPAASLDALMPVFEPDGHPTRSPSAWDPQHTDEETRTLVRRMIDSLPDDFRTVLVLRDIEGLQTADVAAALDLSEPAVKTRLHRARIALRTLLDPHMRENHP